MKYRVHLRNTYVVAMVAIAVGGVLYTAFNLFGPLIVTEYQEIIGLLPK